MEDTLDETVEVTEVEVRRGQIEQTRTDISETLDAIKDKLQPQTLMHQAKATLQDVTSDVAQKARETVHSVVQEAREAIPEVAHNAVSSAVDTAKGAVGNAVDSAKDAVGGVVDSAKDAGSTVIDTIRQNPVPYALISAGLCWLYFDARRNRSREWHGRTYRYVPEYDYQSGYETRPYADESAGSRLDTQPDGEHRTTSGY
jgi:vacuolar-type H+-ATPase subunit H